MKTNKEFRDEYDRINEVYDHSERRNHDKKVKTDLIVQLILVALASLALVYTLLFN